MQEYSIDAGGVKERKLIRHVGCYIVLQSVVKLV